MTDDELVENFMGGMDRLGQMENEIDVMCGRESTQMLKGIKELKLGIAQCKASAAIDCVVKQENVKSCGEIKDNPSSIAKTITNSMCRRFGVRADSKEAKGGLYDVAEKFYEDDPALANQLGDTADTVREEKKKLNFFSYVFGDSQYGSALEERAERLGAIKEKLSGEENPDQESINQIDEEIKKLGEEGGQFKNLLDIGRIGKAFSGEE